MIRTRNYGGNYRLRVGRELRTGNPAIIYEIDAQHMYVSTDAIYRAIIMKRESETM